MFSEQAPKANPDFDRTSNGVGGHEASIKGHTRAAPMSQTFLQRSFHRPDPQRRLGALRPRRAKRSPWEVVPQQAGLRPEEGSPFQSAIARKYPEPASKLIA